MSKKYLRFLATLKSPSVSVQIGVRTPIGEVVWSPRVRSSNMAPSAEVMERGDVRIDEMSYHYAEAGLGVAVSALFKDAAVPQYMRTQFQRSVEPGQLTSALQVAFRSGGGAMIVASVLLRRRAPFPVARHRDAPHGPVPSSASSCAQRVVCTTLSYQASFDLLLNVSRWDADSEEWQALYTQQPLVEALQKELQTLPSAAPAVVPYQGINGGAGPRVSSSRSQIAHGPFEDGAAVVAPRFDDQGGLSYVADVEHTSH